MLLPLCTTMLPPCSDCYGPLSYRHEHDLTLAQFEQAVPLAKAAKNKFLEADGRIGIGSEILWQADVKPAQESLLQVINLCQTLHYQPGDVETLI